MRGLAALRLARAAVITAALLCSCASSASGQSSPGVDAGSRVDLVLERGRFLEPLPFDVQFFLYGDAPEDLVYARGRYARLTKQLRKCEEVLPPAPPPTALVTPVDPPPENRPTQPVSRRDDPKRPPIHVIDVARPFTDEEKSVFELSVDPLEPNKDYCFEFEMFYKIDEAVFREIGLEGIDQALRSAAGAEGTLDRPALYDQARQRIAAAIEAVRAKKAAEKGINIQIIPVAGALFDLTRPALEIPAPFRREFDLALEGQAAMIMLARQVGTAAAEAGEASAELLDNAAFRRMVEQVAARSTNPALALRLTGMSAALGVPNRLETERVAEPFGLTGAELRLAPPLEETWDPEKIAERMARLQERVREYGALGDLARDLAEQQGLRRAAGLDEDTPADNPNALSSEELLEVSELAETARERFEIVLNSLELVQASLTDRAAAIARMTDQLTAASSEIVPFRGTTIGNWETRASQYISLDVGVAAAPAIESTFFYLGTNFYTGPVNKRAHLSWRDQSFRKRFAVLFGIPLNPFEDDQTVDQFAGAPREITGVLANRPLLIGAGWRLTDVVRFSGGTVLFKVQGPNPLVDTEPEPHFTWFMSMSVDWDIKHFFSGLAGQQPQQPE